MKLLIPTLTILAMLTSVVTAAEKPVNILLIMADDVGFECFSSYGSKEYSTPRLDTLAEAGIRFENCHSTPVCTPSRVNLLSGKPTFSTMRTSGSIPKENPPSPITSSNRVTPPS
ncbi:MAG: hypothetical protein CMN58_03135 [Solibacterales bacterium]|nr:hypothetical protein [Bryobacterales bacterium]